MYVVMNVLFCRTCQRQIPLAVCNWWMLRKDCLMLVCLLFSKDITWMNKLLFCMQQGKNNTRVSNVSSFIHLMWLDIKISNQINIFTGRSLNNDVVYDAMIATLTGWWDYFKAFWDNSDSHRLKTRRIGKCAKYNVLNSCRRGKWNFQMLEMLQRGL